MENDLEEKLGAILSDPDMMQKIQAMAQTLGQNSSPQQSHPQQAAPEHTFPSIDLAALQKLSGLVGQAGIDKNQQTLLAALTPYLPQNRVSRLEKAMRAAKMAKLASGFLGSGGLQLFTGR